MTQIYPRGRRSMANVYAVVESVSKAVALGARYDDIYLTLQEYFERLGTDPALGQAV